MDFFKNGTQTNPLQKSKGYIINAADGQVK